MWQRCVCALVVVSAASALLATAPAGASGHGSAAACRAGAIGVTINGTRVCIRAGDHCTIRYQRQYAKYRFTCRSGRLVRTAKASTPTTTVTTAADAAGPFAGTWYAIDPSDGSHETATFGTDGSLAFSDDRATTCGGVGGYATATGAAKGNVWTAAERTTLLCPDNSGSVPNHLFQFTLNGNGTLTETGTPDVWTRDRPW
jgi:hypothetical protein